MRAVFSFFVLALSPAAVAQDEAPSTDTVEASETQREIRYKERTEIDFRVIELEGELLKPSVSVYTARPSRVFPPLVQLRTDWNQELSESVDQVK